jgi:hypothetical protein
MLEGVGKVVVRRPAGKYRHALRSYVVRVDGAAIGKIAPGGEITSTIASGRHEIRAAISWTGSKSVRIDLIPDRTLTFEVRPAGNALMSVLQILGRTGYLTLELVESE